MKFEECIIRLGFTEKERAILTDIHKKCDEKEFSEELARAREEYDKGDEAFGEYISAFSEKSGVYVNTLNLYVYLRFVEDTYAEYRRRGISDEMFLKTLSGLVSVSRPASKEVKEFGIPQNVFRSWYRLALDCKLFSPGGLLFEIFEAPCDIEVDGKSVGKGDSCISVHILRGAKLDDETCEALYDFARGFFKKHFDMDNIIFICKSWLIHPWLCEVLPDTSSIVNFQKKFKIIYVEDDLSGLSWIFGSGAGSAKALGKIEDYPENTSLQRAAKKRLLEGKKLGLGLGARI